MSAGMAFCPECGNARCGITCPDCGTLNFRSFCRKCNRPLNPMALLAVEEARRDPRFIKAQEIAQELQQMEEEMAQLEALIAREKARPAAPERTLKIDDSVSEATRRLMEEFEKLSSTPSAPKVDKPRPQKVESKPEAAPLTLSSDDSGPGGSDIPAGGGGGNWGAAAARLEQLRRQYKAKTAELQAQLDAMVPDPAAPPEVKRNFACARMITTRSTTTTKELARVAWVCNRCHVWHNNPSECCVAEYGGKWVTKEVTKTVESISTKSVNL